MALTKAGVAKMKVVQLKAELKALGLATSGKKNDLQERLNEHIDAQAAPAEDSAMDVAADPTPPPAAVAAATSEPEPAPTPTPAPAAATPMAAPAPAPVAKAAPPPAAAQPPPPPATNGAVQTNGNGAGPKSSEVPGLTAAELAAELKGLSGAARKNKLKKLKKKHKKATAAAAPQAAVKPEPVEADSSAPALEIEYVDEEVPELDPAYSEFAAIFAKLKPVPKEEKEEAAAKPEAAPVPADAEEEEKEEGDEEEQRSRRQLRKLNKLTVAQLKQLVDRPDLVEVHDVSAADPRLLIHLKGKRGIEKKPFELPDYIRNTGIQEMREALQEQDEARGTAGRQRDKVRPKMGKMEIDYQKLHDAFFRFQTKPDHMGIHGDLYYEGKEFETNLKMKKPGDLSEDLKAALGMPVTTGGPPIPPPWLLHMQRYGPPPSYPNLKIPGLNAPIPKGAAFGFQMGGWGKPPVDEYGRPIYGDVFGVATDDAQAQEEAPDETLWGQLDSEDSDESSDEESDEDDSDAEDDAGGLVTPSGMTSEAPSGISSVQTGADTPDMIELRKRRVIEDAMESTEEQTLYTVIPQQESKVGNAMMGSAYTYDVAGAAAAGTASETGAESAAPSVATPLSASEIRGVASAASTAASDMSEDARSRKRKAADKKAEQAAKKFRF